MRVLRGLPYSTTCPSAAVLCLGTFDGVHCGHQGLLERAAAMGLGEVWTLSFEPAPREFFDRAAAPARLSNLLERLLQFRRIGVDGAVILRFNRALAQLSPEQFVVAAIKPLRPQVVVIGADFRFGARRAGDAARLLALGQEHGFKVEVLADIERDGERVSSTALRAALARHDFAHAQHLLGRAYAMSGRVVRGQQLGRKLGFATANMRIKRVHSPLHGIYAVRMHGLPDGIHDGVASIGTRPTVGGTEWLLETHLFDFDQDIYGKRVDVEFVRFLRQELKFDSLDRMIEQMHKDAAYAREALK